MFIDSEMNAQGISSFGDENFSNHPGFIGGTWFKDLTQPGKAESERYDDEVKKQKSDCDYSAGDSCADLDDCHSYFQNLYNANTGNSRAPKRVRKAANHHRTKVNQYMAARDCDGATSAIDIAQEEATQSSDDAWKSNQAADQAASDAAAAIKKASDAAAKAIRDAQNDSYRKINQAKTESANAIKAASDDALLRRMEEKVASDKKDKMILFAGIGVVAIIMVLMLKK